MQRYEPTSAQRDRLDEWLPGAALVTDHSWGLVDRAVWELTHGSQRYIAKVGGIGVDHHIGREIHAHQHWLTPWTSRGLAPSLVHHDNELFVLVTKFLPGELAVGTGAATSPAIFEQAGSIVALLHDQPGVVDDEYEARENRKSLAWLAKPHRIEAADEQVLRELIAAWPTPPAVLVPTHGDWQPRNWLIDHGEVRAIDFGRAALRPAMTDFVRMALSDFDHPGLEAAFLAGYGDDPREPSSWQRELIRFALSTAVWSYQVGDDDFERFGLQMIKKLIASL